ncbi:MAG: flagellar hook-basal body complex protein FliE [Gemmatimonadota bacterium]|nr:flagellar hook-basal body complex protein FliE [Gemmatimonadota bacterium]
MSDPIGAMRGSIGQIGVGGDRGQTIDFLKPKSGGTSFGDTLKKAIGEASQAQDAAQDLTAKYLHGEPVELHQVMAATEEAGIALEFMVELRNKFTDAYRTVINMQS